MYFIVDDCGAYFKISYNIFKNLTLLEHINMYKLHATFLGLSLLTATLMSAESQTPSSVKENKGEGFYLGAGFGASFYNLTLTKSDYYVQDGDEPEYHLSSDDMENMDDKSEGYLFYAGYQFNKIIAVEASYTDYGTFESTISKTVLGNVLEKNYTKKPTSIAVYANAGYTFLNAQLRPFGLLGLGYVSTRQSSTYDQIDLFSDDTFVSIHIGTGLDYYPTAFHGFGFRVSVTADNYYDNTTVAYENTTDDKITDVALWQSYSLLYIGAQYKF